MAKDPMIPPLPGVVSSEDARKGVKDERFLEKPEAATVAEPEVPAETGPAPAPEAKMLAAQGVTEEEFAKELFVMTQTQCYELAAKFGVPKYKKLARMKLLRAIANAAGFPGLKFPTQDAYAAFTPLNRISSITGVPIPQEIEDYLNQRQAGFAETKYSARVLNALESRAKELGF
jgi:hypothetical protein